ncbi:MAG: N-6 DNA methylase [Chloroflexota bacterium]|nr:N-6 DNA methylase [Chloroflexota bacterium]MDE2930812.1 N-6 DNA methylase [Chloroflexota bacterium]
MSTLAVERDTEILIDNQLRNLGWNSDPRSRDRNVYLQRVRTEEQRGRLEGRRPDYTLYRSHSDQPIAVIEAKKPGQNMQEAINQGHWYASRLDAPLVFATDGVFTKTLHTKLNQPLKLNGEDLDELIRETLALRFLQTNDVSTLDKKVVQSRSDLISIFSTVNDLLREEGLHQGIERFTEFANILFIKVLSEIEDGKEERGERSTIDMDYRWDAFRYKRGQELLSYVSDTVLKWFGHAYQDENIFQPLQISHPDNLRAIINRLSDLQLTDINADIKGDAFEYFIRSYSASSPSDLGEIFTPRHIVKTMVRLVRPQIGETVYDPFCGTGGMLTVAYKYLMDTMPRNEGNLRRLRQDTVFGADLTKTASIAKMNMILAGDGHNNIIRQDSLATPVDSKYDIVITNMPFAQKTRYGDRYEVPSRNGDIIGPQHCFRALRPDGRMALIVPDGFLSNTNSAAYRQVRQLLFENATLKSIVSLPRGAFEPYNRSKTSILYFTDAKKPTKANRYWVFDVRNDGYTLDKRRRPLGGGNDLELVLSENRLEEQGIVYLQQLGIDAVDADRVRVNDYVLHAAPYRLTSSQRTSSRYPMVRLGDLLEEPDKNLIGESTNAPVMSITSEHGLVDQSEKFKKRVASTDISNYKKVYRNEMVVGFPIDEGVLGFQTKYEFAAVSPAYTIWRIRSSDIELDLTFMELVLRSAEMRLVYRSMMHGSVDRRRSIPKSLFKDIRIPIPPLSAQQDFRRKYEEIEETRRLANSILEEIEDDISDLWFQFSDRVKGKKQPRLQPTSSTFELFYRLAAEWRESREPGDTHQMALHMAYQRIIGLGKPAVPFILRELKRNPDHWFWALNAITGEDPVPQNAQGELGRMTEAWLEWGREEGYVD